MDDDEVAVPEEEIEVLYFDDEDEEESNDVIEEDVDEFENIPFEEPEEFQTEVVDLSKYTFTRHGQSVFSSSLSKDGKIAVTGGEDDSAFVWILETGDVIIECTGHKDSVTEVLFNHDDQYVATGDMGGLIQVWSIIEKKLIWCYEVDDLEWLLWHPISNVLFCGTKSGDIYLWQVPSGTCKILPSHGVASTCAKLLPDGKRLISGYSDGKLKLWDIKTVSSEWQLSDISDAPLTSLSLSSDGNVCAIAPSGQVIKLQDGRIIGSILPDKEKDIEAVEFNNKLGLIATGSLSGRLCVWDIGKYTLRHEARIESSVTIMKWTVTDKVLVGAADGAIYVCDGKLGTLVETLTGHTAAILSLSISEDGSTVLTTSDDGTAKIFNIRTG
ncbi:angio-associated migratory cell protein [Agrilus planipennis]|uniref:Angio-associated migratory cell protein n=1 Tax=Agrilus planipennis TaxID=224129 RepID=A0A1W4XAL2_AGRPL|nr:angio-associated migratory cell protein [Agrilus planipennis]